MKAPPRPTGLKPYYRDDFVTIYHGDCAQIVPKLGKFDLLLTDPPYGIKRDKGIGGKGYDGFGNKLLREPKKYEGGWDSSIPDKEIIDICLESSEYHIIWGGNYLSSLLPQKPKWLIWDKEQTMPSYSDGELAWSSLDGVSVKMFRYNGSGLMAKEKGRQHPTQKPLNLILWCITLVKVSNTILDPFAGSGTTGRAAKDLKKQCVLIEREEKYCEIAAKRMAQEVLI